MEGHLEEGFRYLAQAEFRRDTPLLDVILRWRSEGGTMLQAGYFRTPTAGELLIAAPNLDFIDRAEIVRTLSADRQVGVQLDHRIAGRALVARVGVFGGDGLDGGDDERFLYTSRPDGVVTCDDGETEIAHGASAFHSRDESALDSSDVPDQEICGYPGSVGWTVNRLVQILARYDSLH